MYSRVRHYQPFRRMLQHAGSHLLVKYKWNSRNAGLPKLFEKLCEYPREECDNFFRQINNLN
jgi:hypothetical protein